MQTCYMCDAHKTSDEHVPPKCLFPEQKDSEGADYRKNLITVPSCDAHNSTKSKEDEFLLMYMAANACTNHAAELQQNTKLARILERKPHVWAMLLSQATPAVVVGADGRKSETCAFHIDGNRFRAQMDHIARGIYFHHFQEKWLNRVDLNVIQGIFANTPTALTTNSHVQGPALALFSNIEKHGSNQAIFFYQVVQAASGALALCSFYENTKVIFSYPANKA